MAELASGDRSWRLVLETFRGNPCTLVGSEGQMRESARQLRQAMVGWRPCVKSAETLERGLLLVRHSPEESVLLHRNAVETMKLEPVGAQSDGP